MTIERDNYETISEAAITTAEIAECSVAERGILVARNALRTAGDIGKIIINGDLAETLRQSANHLS